MLFQFNYEDEEYWISKNSADNYLTKVSDGYTQEFKNLNELLEKAEIDGKSIMEIREKGYCFCDSSFSREHFIFQKNTKCNDLSPTDDVGNYSLHFTRLAVRGKK